MERSWAEWQVEMYEDLYVRRNDIKAQITDGDVDQRKAIKVLNAIEGLLGDPSGSGSDPMVDKWERELDEGKTPDLND